MNLNTNDIDLLIKKFRDKPDKDSYDTIKDWYDFNMDNFNIEEEYMICIYLFLQGANIKQNYYPISVDEHRDLVVQLRDYIERADPLYKNRRKTYLDYGTKAGFHK